MYPKCADVGNGKKSEAVGFLGALLPMLPRKYIGMEIYKK
jgi:hypothetical protein